ncbi:hypothetical protein ACIBBE_42790 [Streptomyces sp. NPDC051644]|uniref:hypothetical protein n=1 Tax=Streptomyces sp. NPDC051644 TaxID=3365666 RepID=UPI0037913D4A
MSVHMVTIALATDGRSWVDGTEIKAAPDGTVDGARATALDHVARIARQRRRPVRVEATDPTGDVWRFVVDESGHVHDPDKVQELRDDPDAHQVPPEARAAVAEIVAAVVSGRGHVAMTLARQLEDKATAEHGAGHPHALRAAELRAHAAQACGVPGIACEVYIDAARGWHQLGSDEYWPAVQRAFALWHRVQNEPAGTAWLGQQLVDVLELGGSRAAATIGAVLRRIDELRFEGDVAS